VVAFEVRQEWIDRVAVLSVRGDIDALTAPRLTDAILGVVPDQPSAVIVDLSEVEFLASSGITVLVSTHEQISANAQFGVVADGPTTSRPLKLMAIDAIIPLYPTLQDALAVFRRA
jgi:anti-sigma B factor antagonist